MSTQETPPIVNLHSSQHPIVALEESIELLRQTSMIPLSSSVPISTSPTNDSTSHLSSSLILSAEISTTKPSTINYHWHIPTTTTTTKHWVGLYACGLRNTYLKYQWAGSVDGSGSFDCLGDGIYQLKLHAAKETLQTTEQLTLGDPCSLSVGGEDLRVLVVRFNAAPTTCVVGLFKSESENTTPLITKQFAEGSKSDDGGMVMMTDTPRTPGKYEIRLFKTSASRAYSAMVPFIVPNLDYIQFSSSPDQQSLLQQQQQTVQLKWKCRAFERTSNDWIGLYTLEDAEQQKYKKYLQFKYLVGGDSDGKLDEDQHGDAGTLSWSLPLLNPGKYCFVLFTGQLGKYEAVSCPPCIFEISPKAK